MRAPYRLQNRSGGGIQIQQSGRYILLSRDEIEALINDLARHLEHPVRVDETTKWQPVTK